MEYEPIGMPFEFENFSSMNKKQAEAYFQWYMERMPSRLQQLEIYVNATSNQTIPFDYSVESLIPLWEWYETKIIVEEKSQEEMNKEIEGKPDWVKEEMLKNTTKISLDTWLFGMDVAIYFAEVFRKHNPSVQWGYFTKPKSKISVNRPVLMGFVKRMTMDTRGVVVIGTLRSSREKKATRLYDIYFIWQKYIEKKK